MTNSFTACDILFTDKLLKSVRIRTLVHTDLAIPGKVVNACIGKGAYRVERVVGPRYCCACGLGLAQLQTSATCLRCTHKAVR